MEPRRRGRRNGVMLRRLLGPALALACATPRPAIAQDDPVLASRAAYQQAVKAYEAHDVPAFLAHARDAQRLRPDHGGMTYALACADAMTGDTAGAIRAYRHYLVLQADPEPAARPRVERVRAELAALTGGRI